MKKRNKVLKNAISEVRGNQAKLAKMLNVSPQTISERLNDDKEIDSVEFIQAVAQLTGKSFYSLLLTDEPNVIDVAISVDGSKAVNITKYDAENFEMDVNKIFASETKLPYRERDVYVLIEELKRRVDELEKKLTPNTK